MNNDDNINNDNQDIINEDELLHAMYQVLKIKQDKCTDSQTCEHEQD